MKLTLTKYRQIIAEADDLISRTPMLLDAEIVTVNRRANWYRVRLAGRGRYLTQQHQAWLAITRLCHATAAEAAMRRRSPARHSVSGYLRFTSHDS